MTFSYTHLGPKEVDFVAVAAEDELANGERLFVEIDEYTIVVFNIAGQFFAIHDVCSHDDGPVGEGELEGHLIVCPRHGARFDVRDGSVKSLPAIIDSPAYPVRIADGMIEVGVPHDE